MKHDLWFRIAAITGRRLEHRQLVLLERYRDWLVSEASSAGGIGPAESPRVDQRHLADSLLFATPLDHDPDLIWDIGSGVGLPGIPLAILMTDTEVVLIDRSERRVDLANRAIGVLGLDNVKVRQVDVEEIVGSFPTVVSRATLSPARMSELLRDRLLPGAMIIKGGSWTNRPLHPGWETLEIPPTVLDHTVWLLIMRRQ